MATDTSSVKINNVAYSWSMLELSSNTFPSTILAGVTAVKWNRKVNVATNYGLGGKPRSRGFGNWEYTASITLDYNGQAQLRELGNGSLLGLGEFDLTVSWVNDYGSDLAEDTVVLKKCFFNEEGLEVSQDDTDITKEFDLNPFDIQTNGEV
jgi:hypothetical protein